MAAIGGNMILGIDPGAKPGFAVLANDRSLLFVGREPPDLGKYRFTAFIERPELRPLPPGTRRKVNPNGIVTLAFTAGRIAGQIAARSDCVALTAISPREWKGCVEKRVMINRIHCRYPGPWTDDEIDAIGIAAYALGVDWVRGPW